MPHHSEGTGKASANRLATPRLKATAGVTAESLAKAAIIR